MKHLYRTACAAAVLTAAVWAVRTPGILAQGNPPAQADAPPTFRTEINYVQVSARVVDAQGNFVRNLRREDFQILEDNRPQRVTIFDLVDIPAGDPQKWDWDERGNLRDPKTAPMIGLVSLLEGASPPGGQEVVDPGFKGLQKEVLTPGVYKINPVQKNVTLFPAVVVPPGSVGVTRAQFPPSNAQVSSS